MKVLAINGSPRGKKGNTYKILKPFVKGLKTEAEVEIINLSEHNIQPCKGCVICLKVTPGICVIKDDMTELLDKMAVANLIVYGTPLYIFSMSGMMKNFLDRSLPLRETVEQQKIFLVSSCAYPPLEQFEPLVSTFKLMAKKTNKNYLGEILRTTANIENDKKQKEFYTLLEQAGQQLITTNKIEEKLLKQLHEPWISEEEFYERMKNLVRNVGVNKK